MHRPVAGSRLISHMKLVSLNIGLPRLLSWKGATFKTAFFKAPVSGRVMLRATNLDGDCQADLSVHGGPNKAVYGYPSEHYAYWSQQLPGYDLPWGAFGENWTTEGLLETKVSVGERYRVGSAAVMVTIPRLPCYKLAAKFQRDDMIERFLSSGRCGYYFSVVEEGEVGAGDEFQVLGGEAPTISILETFQAYTSLNLELLQRAARVKTLPESWQERFQIRIDAIKRAARFERNSRVR